MPKVFFGVVDDMEQDKVTSTDLKRFNFGNVFAEVYSKRELSKQSLAGSLHLSMPTVNQALKRMDELRLIRRDGLFQSTGGRRAQIYRFNSTARIAVGAELLKGQLRILACDLFGNIISELTVPEPFAATEQYYKKLGGYIDRFVHALDYPREDVLGAMVSVQGLLSADGVVSYSEIYNCIGLSAADLQPYIPLPCFLVHDSESSAFAELWFRPEIREGVLLILNRYFGGALMLDGKVYQGKAFPSGILEHICLDPNGPPCYCGKRGCIETFCSADSLRRQAGEGLDTFFFHLRQGDAARRKIWDEYLQYLALAIDNIRTLIDCDFIIGGDLLHSMEDEDFAHLERLVQARCSFSTQPFHLCRSCCGAKAAALGAALLLVEQFLTDTGFNMERCKKGHPHAPTLLSQP